MPVSARYKWWVVGMLWCVCLFNYADRQAIFSVFPLLKSEMGLSDWQLGIVGAAFMWIYAICAPLAGLVGDRVNRKHLILGGMVFWSLITLATALAQNYWQLVTLRALEGLGETFYFPASMSLLADYHGHATRSRAMAIHQSSVYAGTILGGGAAGFLAQHYGWRSGFFLFGGLGILLAVALMAFLKEPARGEADQHSVHIPVAAMTMFEGAGEIFRNRMVLILMAVFAGANFVAMIFLTWMPSFLFSKFGMSQSMAGLSGTAYLQIAAVLGVVCGGVLADRLAKKHKGGRMLTQSLGLLAGTPFIFLTGWTLSVPVLVVAMSCFGFFKGLYDANTWASLYDVVPLRRRATAVGLMNSIGWLSGSAAPLAIAAASERFGMSASISAGSTVYLATGLLLALGIYRYMRPAITEAGNPDLRN
jgi:MFS family permease